MKWLVWYVLFWALPWGLFGAVLYYHYTHGGNGKGWFGLLTLVVAVGAAALGYWIVARIGRAMLDKE